MQNLLGSNVSNLLLGEGAVLLKSLPSTDYENILLPHVIHEALEVSIERVRVLVRVPKIGRASCRERVEIELVAVTGKKRSRRRKDSTQLMIDNRQYAVIIPWS